MSGVQVEATLVHTKFIVIPGVGTVTAGRFTGGDRKPLDGEPSDTRHLDVRLLRSQRELAAVVFNEREISSNNDKLVLLRFLDFFLVLIGHQKKRSGIFTYL